MAPLRPPSTNGPSTCLPPGCSDAETFFRRPLAAEKCSAAVPDTGSRRTSRALWTPSPARFSAANLVRHKNKSLRDQMSGSVRKATVGAGVRGGGTKVWGGLGWSHHRLLYPTHPRYSPCARQQQHDKVKTFALVTRLPRRSTSRQPGSLCITASAAQILAVAMGQCGRGTRRRPPHLPIRRQAARDGVSQERHGKCGRDGRRGAVFARDDRRTRSNWRSGPGAPRLTRSWPAS